MADLKWFSANDLKPEYNTPVRVLVGDGMSFLARYVKDASVDEDENVCDQWQAVLEGEHPPCWSNGAQWANNEDEVASMPVRQWRALLEPEMHILQRRGLA